MLRTEKIRRPDLLVKCGPNLVANYRSKVSQLDLAHGTLSGLHSFPETDLFFLSIPPILFVVSFQVLRKSSLTFFLLSLLLATSCLCAQTAGQQYLGCARADIYSSTGFALFSNGTRTVRCARCSFSC